MANLVIALASFKTAQSVVGLSESPLFYHQYSSVTAAISTLAKTQHELKRVRKIFQKHWLRYLCWLKGCKIHWQTDGVRVVSGVFKMFERYPIYSQSERQSFRQQAGWNRVSVVISEYRGF